MNDSIVRISKIELINFKNVENGVIDFKENLDAKDYELKSNILGIYGQNGSGKTALVDAGRFLKRILQGKPLPIDSYNYINALSETACLKFEFSLRKKEKEYIVFYEVEIKKKEDKCSIISREKLSISKKADNSWTSKVTLIDYDYKYDDEVFLPKYKYQDAILKDEDNIVNLKVAKKMSLSNNTSFIFNDEVRSILSNSKEFEDYSMISDSLTYFSKYNLFVIMNDHSGVISMNMLMPFSFRIEKNEGITSGDIALRLDGPTIVNQTAYSILNKIVAQMNMVLKYIVPSLQLELYNYGEQHNEQGDLVTKVELLSKRGETNNEIKLPIKYESEGIKKIISILSALIAMYNKPSICMFVDELDSGIYEFLLGEILQIIQNGGKGQMIFTSHNLRPLEVLNKNSLYFTTTNRKNRYIRFSNLKNNNNLRSSYIRCISLGGQKEKLYEETNSIEIQRAFRLAGDKFNDI